MNSVTLNKTNDVSAIADIVRNDVVGGVLPKVVATLAKQQFKLDLGMATITYPATIDAIFNRSGINSEAAKALIILFRKYKYGIIDHQKLQRRIANLAIPYIESVRDVIQNKGCDPVKLREILSKNDFQKNYGLQLSTQQIENKIAKISKQYQPLSLDLELEVEVEEKQEDVNLQAEKLFKVGVSASKGAENQNIVVCVGNTGSGKSTTINFLMKKKLKSIKKEDLGIKTVGENIIIAENPVTAIGHRNVSKTSSPIVVPDKVNDLAFCDWPGFKDTRGTVVEIYNAMSGMDVLEKAKSVKGFLFFIDCLELKASRGKAIIDNMRFLQLLLQDFKIHQRAILFIVTKATRGDTLQDIKELLQQSVEDIVKDKQNYSRELRSFCLDVHKASFLNNGGLGQKVVICEPCGPQSDAHRDGMLKIIKEFAYDKNAQKKFGYAISEKVESKIDMSRVSIIFQAQQTLATLQRALKPYWEQETEKSNTQTDKRLVEKTKSSLDKIQQWQRAFKKELSHFVSQHYVAVSKDLTDTLSQALAYWNKLGAVSGQAPKMENLGDHFDNLLRELQSIEAEIKALWFSRMHAMIKVTFQRSLRIYETQSNLQAMRGLLPNKKLDTLNAAELHNLVVSLANATKVPLEYPQKILEILNSDRAKCTDLIEVIRVNIVDPIHVENQNGTLHIKGNAYAVALSEILTKAHDSFQAAKEIWITDTSKVYFNSSLTAEHFKGKVIYIQAGEIEIKKNCEVDLALTWRRGGSITLKGRLMGDCNIQDKKFKLTTGNKLSEKIELKKCQWPL